jgi:D-alanine-D-alanine ligase
MAPTRLLLAYGGASSEHEVSIRSARSILDAIDRERFDPIPLAVRRDGGWRTGCAGDDLATLGETGQPVADLRALAVDLVFPALHGPYGEDGTFQGMLEIYGLPYVGSGVLASALCMDKIAQKQLVAAAAPDVPLVPWCEVTVAQLADGERARTAARVLEVCGVPCFVKPANLGSSVGVVKVERAEDLPAALAAAARYDHRVIVEAGIDAREIELAVLGNGDAETIVSPPGEIELPPGVWYDYETKYEKDVATYHIPAQLPAEVASALQHAARRAFVATGCKGLARIDFFVERGTDRVFLNELNTMPGFTSISMYPKLMANAGVPYRQLITRLCELAVAHHATRRTLLNSR